MLRNIQASEDVKYTAAEACNHAQFAYLRNSMVRNILEELRVPQPVKKILRIETTFYLRFFV